MLLQVANPCRRTNSAFFNLIIAESFSVFTLHCLFNHFYENVAQAQAKHVYNLLQHQVGQHKLGKLSRPS